MHVQEGATAITAVKLSGIAVIFPEIDVDTIEMGIFGKIIKNPADHKLRDGDRVELYRPLRIDPKQARLNRANRKSAPRSDQ